MKSFINITGKKEGKTYKEAVILLSPTTGEFRITPLVAKQLGLVDGDSALVVIDPDNKEQVYIAKGIRGVLALDEAGEVIKDSRSRDTYDEAPFGAIIREVKEGSSLLKLTAAAAWTALGGNDQEAQEFTLGEGEEGQVPNGEDLHTTVFYPLVFKTKRPKIVRTKGEAGESEDTSDANQVDAFAEFEEEEEV